MCHNVVGRGFGGGVITGIGDELDSNVGDEVLGVVKL